jgi:hypothetical protein
VFSLFIMPECEARTTVTVSLNVSRVSACVSATCTMNQRRSTGRAGVSRRFILVFFFTEESRVVRDGAVGREKRSKERKRDTTMDTRRPSARPMVGRMVDRMLDRQTRGPTPTVAHTPDSAHSACTHRGPTVSNRPTRRTVSPTSATIYTQRDDQQ